MPYLMPFTCNYSSQLIITTTSIHFLSLYSHGVEVFFYRQRKFHYLRRRVATGAEWARRNAAAVCICSQTALSISVLLHHENPLAPPLPFDFVRSTSADPIEIRRTRFTAVFKTGRGAKRMLILQTRSGRFGWRVGSKPDPIRPVLNPPTSMLAVKVARLFGPAIFEASKLKVLFLGVDEKKHPGNLPRTYTLTHSDITSKLTLAISQTINNSQLQGWYNRLYRDEVVAEWKKLKGKMSLHVHCHISGGHFLLDLCARLRYFIFCKELPVVLKAFVHGDVNLFNSYPELEESQVWVYFHSNIPEFNKVECWGPLREAGAPSGLNGSTQLDKRQQENLSSNWHVPKPCEEDCCCCFPPMSMMIPWPHDDLPLDTLGSHQALQEQQNLGRSGGTL